MNNEIRKILEHLKRLESQYLELKKSDSPFNDEEYQAHLLLDFITNLQKEIKALQQENERLKEILKYKQKRESELFTIESVLETNSQLYDERNIYKSRLKKAVEKSQELKDSIDKSNFDGMTKTILILGINQIQNTLQNGSDSNV